MSESRKQFEEWVKTSSGLYPQKDEHGEYMTTIVQHWSVGWSARDSEVERLREALTRAEGAMTYSAATVAIGNRHGRDGDWVGVHAGRADSSYRQLKDAIDTARAALSSQVKESGK